jgi:dienelactone hydrolase
MIFFATTYLEKAKEILVINLYNGVKHGFAVRGDRDDRVVRYAVNNAFLQALEWFKEHLSN